MRAFVIPACPCQDCSDAGPRRFIFRSLLHPLPVCHDFAVSPHIGTPNREIIAKTPRKENFASPRRVIRPFSGTYWLPTKKGSKVWCKSPSLMFTLEASLKMKRAHSPGGGREGMPDLLKSLAGGSDNEACQPPPPPPITGREGQDCPWDGGRERRGSQAE